MAYIGKSPSLGIRDRYYFSDISGLDSVSGQADDGRVMTFSDARYVDVSLNGVSLVSGQDYTPVPSTNKIINLAQFVDSDIVEVIVFDVFSVSDAVSAERGGSFNNSIAVNGTLTANKLQVDFTLDSLSDVNLGTPANNQVLTYKSSSGQFELDSAASSMTGLSDVDLTGLQDGHTIIYDATSQQFQADSIASGSNTTTFGLWENAGTISADYTITSGNNAISAGPILIDSAVSVTIPNGSRWVVT